jgi:hypothetical protein
MTIEELKRAIHNLDVQAQRTLYLWLQERMTDLRAPLPTENELDVLIAVRTMELNNEVPTTSALEQRLGITHEALIKRIERLNKTRYNEYLVLSKSSAGTAAYSTIYNKMIRQPETALMALVFDSGRVSTIRELERYGAEHGISDVEFFRDYLTELHYFEDRGRDQFGPGLRLNAEKRYIQWLAGLWPVQNKHDMATVVRYQNDILSLVWQQENGVISLEPGVTQRALAEACIQQDVNPRALVLAEHAVRSLVTDGSLKERFDPRTNTEVYFLNERDDPGHSVVTWPDTAFLMNALDENLIQPRTHRVTMEQFVGHALQGGLSLATTMEAIRFCENAGYITLRRSGEHSGRIWRTERLKSQSSYIKFLAGVYEAGRPYTSDRS